MCPGVAAKKLNPGRIDLVLHSQAHLDRKLREGTGDRRFILETHAPVAQQLSQTPTPEATPPFDELHPILERDRFELLPKLGCGHAGPVESEGKSSELLINFTLGQTLQNKTSQFSTFRTEGEVMKKDPHENLLSIRRQ
jgi:hypothetical protein